MFLLILSAYNCVLSVLVVICLNQKKVTVNRSIINKKYKHMKRNIFLVLSLLITTVSWTQIITSTPAIVTNDYNGVITLVYDATQGTAGLKDYAGTDGVYAHTGVITNESTSSSDWKHAPSKWGDNAPKYKLTALGNNKWQLLITPDMTSYYGLNSGEVVKKLAFVFRNGKATKEGKATGGADIFLDVYDAGLNVSITNPVNKATEINTTETVEVASTIAANLELFVNGTSVKSTSGTTALSYSITYNRSIDYTLVAKATVGNASVYDTTYVCVPAPVTNQVRPTGVKDGITYSADKTQATLVMYAPGKSNIFLIGDFNDWIQKNSYQLKKDGNYWWITITGLIPDKLYGFQYLVDNTLRVTDPYTELVLDPWNDKWINEHHNIYPNLPAYPTGKTTGLVGTLQGNKPPYNWQVSSFTFQHHDNTVIYEMLLRDFTDEKSLEAAIDKLDYLNTLGVTAIELLPIQEFDGNNSWGYNPNLYFAPDKAYGSPTMYKKFIDECHKRGMAVILDMVFNQANGLHPFALLYWNATANKPAADNPWMNENAPHQFSVLNDFDHSFIGTREYFKRVLDYWITEYKVDGYRMDLTKGFTQNSGTESSYDQSRVDYLTEYYHTVKAANPNAMFILEHLVGGNEENTLAEKGMYLWRNVNNAYSQSAMGYQNGADFNAMNSFPRKWVGYAESHDEERNFYKAKVYGNGAIKTDASLRLGRVPLNIAFTVLTPGPKMIWQFGELGFDYSINDFGGRTNPKPAVWNWLDDNSRKQAYEKSSKIITLKKMFPKAFMEGNFILNIGGGDWNAGKRISLTHGDLNMVMLGNFLPSNSITANPNFPTTGTWYELLSGDELNVANRNMTLQISAGDVKIYTDRKVVINSSVKNTKSSIEMSITPNIVQNIIRINTPHTVTKVMIYNAQGTLLQVSENSSKLDVRNLSAGMYLLEVITNNGKGIGKFIKK